MRITLVTTIPRAILALILGAFTGSGIFLLGTFSASLLASRLAGRQIASYPWQDAALIFLAIYGVIFVWFIVGLVVLGTPAWLLMHRLGRRNWTDATILGASLSFLCYPTLLHLNFLPPLFGPGAQLFADALATESNNGHSSNSVIMFALFLNTAWIAISGAISAVTIWGIAYEKRSID